MCCCPSESIVTECVADVAAVICQERKFLEQQQENTEAAMRRLAEQHRATVAQLEHKSLQLKHQLLRGLCAVSPRKNIILSVCVS